jgi:hypothetical protein
MIRKPRSDIHAKEPTTVPAGLAKPLTARNVAWQAGGQLCFTPNFAMMAVNDEVLVEA